MQKETDLIKDNILKDRRRRYLYLSKDHKSGLQLQESELPKFSILGKMSMWSVMIFIIPFGIFKLSLTLSFSIALITYLAGTLYFKIVVLKDRNAIELTETELKKLKDPELIKAQKSAALSEILIPIFLILIIVSRLLDIKSPVSDLDMNVGRFAMAAFAAYSAYLTPKYLKLRKASKKS